MTLTILATRNKKSGQYGRFDLNPHTDEQKIIEAYSVAVIEADEKASVLMKELDLYMLGTFDTATGVISSSEPKFLLDLGAVTYGKVEEQ